MHQAAFYPVLMWWKPAAGLDKGQRGTLKWDLQSYLHIEVQAFIPKLAYPYIIMGFHLHHCQHTKLCAGAWNTFICQWKSLEVV